MATKKEAGIGPLTTHLSDLEAMIALTPQATEIHITVAKIVDDPEKCQQFRITVRSVADIEEAKRMAVHALKQQQKTIRAAIKKAGIAPVKAKKAVKK